MDDNTIQIFKLIKEKKFNKIIHFIKDKNINNLDIKDSNYNYFIQFIIIYNQSDLLKLLLDMISNDQLKLRLDILDIDGRSLLYNCIKFNYTKIIKLLIDYNDNNIGISIMDIKDKFGLTALHYSVIFNNIFSFKCLLENKANPYINSYDNNNIFHTILLYNRDEMMDYLLDKNYSLYFVNIENETLLQSAVNYHNINIIEKILNKTKNLNNINNKFGLSILHQSIINNNVKLFKLLLKKNIDINLTDFYGNTPLHYILFDKLENFLLLIILNNNINFNLTNINGDTPLHILLDYENIDDLNIKCDDDNKLIDKFILNTDLNLQNNDGLTCFKKLINKNLIVNFKNILINKTLNINIFDTTNKKNVFNDELIEILVESYYNQLIKNNNLIIDWELWCNKYNNKNNFDNMENKNDLLIYNNLKKIIKSNESNKYNINNICKEKIRSVIINENRSVPLINYKINIEKDVSINNCNYTGSPIDILFGLLFLEKEFAYMNLNIILDYPLTINNLLENHYEKIGIIYPYKMDFSNIEIIWSFQKIIFPSYFDSIIKKKIKTSKYIIIPIGIETSLGSHANILFWDITNSTIERFDPNGAKYPVGFNYNPELLDSLLYAKFITFDKNIKFYKPTDFLPTIGFQILENLETNKCKKIGDPNGFCGIWCIWWIFQRLKNINILLDNISNELIKQIKFDNLSFKNIIRNFSKKITDQRDSFLIKYNIDINDWINGNYNQELLDKLEKDIFNYIQ